jgi:hypothetical protein
MATAIPKPVADSIENRCKFMILRIVDLIKPKMYFGKRGNAALPKIHLPGFI